MVVRTTLWSGTPDQLEIWGKAQLERVKPMAEGAPGLLAVHCLVDRENGRAMTITVWRNDEAFAATEELAETTRRQTIEEAGVALDGVSRWEVVF